MSHNLTRDFNLNPRQLKLIAEFVFFPSFPTLQYKSTLQSSRGIKSMDDGSAAGLFNRKISDRKRGKKSRREVEDLYTIEAEFFFDDLTKYLFFSNLVGRGWVKWRILWLEKKIETMEFQHVVNRVSAFFITNVSKQTSLFTIFSLRVGSFSISIDSMSHQLIAVSLTWVVPIYWPIPSTKYRCGRNRCCWSTQLTQWTGKKNIKLR